MVSLTLAKSLRSSLKATTSLQALLFSASEPGFTFEPWDITTLYQDRAGTTPVTAAGQSVGLRLSKDQGLRIGPEQSANPGNPFTSTAGFTAATSTISLVAGRIKTFIPAATSGAAGIYWDTTVTANKAQKIVMDIEAEGRTFEVRIYNGASFATLLATDTISAGVRRNVSFTVTPTTSAVRVYILEASGADRSVYLASVSIRELAGNHEVAVSDAKRGVYGWMPKTGRRNLLAYTEQFDNAAWTKSNATVTANAGTAPDGTDTADSVAFNGAIDARLEQGVSVASQVTFSIWMRVASGTASVLIGTRSANVVAVTITNTWQRFSMTAADSAFPRIRCDSAATVYLWGAQLEPGSTATAYQRVVSQYDITEAGVPTCYYVQADGVDDAYVTPTITPNTDKAQVFAGVRKLSDAASGILVELSVNSESTNGAIGLAVPGSATKFITISRGTVFQTAGTADAAYNAPTTRVLAATSDIAGDSLKLRINGAQVAQSTADQGTGNYLAYPAYIYSRAGTSLPFNGLDFGHAVRFGPNLDAATIARVEALIARNTPEVML